jgi:photosystem II stability/assembly factor-like uncharacterized protein
MILTSSRPGASFEHPTRTRGTQETRFNIPRPLKRTSFALVLLLYAFSFRLGMPGRLSGATALAQFERLGPFGGDVRSLLVDANNPAMVYLGTSDGQIFKSTDGGASWNLLVPGIGQRKFVIDTLVQHPVEPDVLYAGAWDLRSNGGGLFESRDAGLTWTRLALPQQSSSVRDLAICRSKPSYMVVGTLDGVYVSDDAGKKWRRVGRDVPGLRNVKSIAIHPRDPRILFGGTFRLPYRSTDFGKTWTRIEQGMYFDSDVFSITVDAQNPEVLFAGACSGIYRSINRGESWTRLRVVPKRFTVRTHVVYIDPFNSHWIYAGTTEGLFLTRDRGQTWKSLTSRALTVNAIQVDPKNNRKIMIATDDQGVLRSDDGGETWKESNLGFVHRQISRIMPDPETSGQFLTGVVSDGSKGGLFVFNKHGQWLPLTSQIATGGLEILSFLSLPGERGRLAGTARGLHWEKPGSKLWAKVPGDIARAVVNDLVLDPSNEWIYAATNEGVFRADIETVEFQRPPALRFKPNVLTLAVVPGTPPAIYAGTNFGVMRSSDQGIKWEIVSNGLPYRSGVECLAVSPANRQHIFAGTVAGLFETLDEGVSWRKVRDGRLGVEVPAVIFLDSAGKRIMAADRTFGGVFLSEDGGVRWEKVAAAEFASPVRSLARDPARPQDFYLGTQSEGVYRLRLQSSP